MNENMTQQELLDYIIDKFNITMEFEEGQLEIFFEQFCKKIITWELVTSILALITSIIIIVIVSVIFNNKNKKLGIITFLKDWSTGQAFDGDSGIELRNKERKMAIYSVVLAVVIIIIAILTPLAISELIDIIKCIAFPERVILEFIGQYI